MFLLINKTQAKCCSTHATSGTPYTGKVHTAGDVTLKQSDKPLLWKGGEGDDTCDAVESWILQTNIPQTNALLPCIVRWSKVGSSPYSRNYFFWSKHQREANSLFEISGFYSGDRTSKENGSYSKLTLLFQRNIIERWKQKRTSTLWVSCNPHSFYSHVTSSIACEMALCLGKGWKTREERKRKGESP